MKHATDEPWIERLKRAFGLTKPMTLERLVRRLWKGRLRERDVLRFLQEGGDMEHRIQEVAPLVWNAADAGDMELVKFLVARGADINARDAFGNTSLHWVVDNDCNTDCRGPRPRATELPFTQVILALGADESIKNDRGETARDIAVAYGDRETALYDSLLRNRGGGERPG